MTDHHSQELWHTLSCAIQAPIILIAQNRQSVKDRTVAGREDEVNLKAELAIMTIQGVTRYLSIFSTLAMAVASTGCIRSQDFPTDKNPANGSHISGSPEEDETLKEPISTLEARSTPVPAGVMVLLSYPPLVMDYDPARWQDESDYSPTEQLVNHLQSKAASTCQIGIVPGPSGFFPTPDEIIRLGSVEYQVTRLVDLAVSNEVISYIENESLSGFDYDLNGLPVIFLSASASEMTDCRRHAEIVLATLRVSGSK